MIQCYIHISTDEIDTEAGWDYDPEKFDDLLALGYLVEVEKNDLGEWVKVKHE